MKKLIEKKDDIVMAFLILCAAGVLFFRPTRVSGYSMYPTIRENEIIFRMPDFMKEDIGYGDVVIVQPYSSNKKLIKRVVGMPGDTIEIRDGSLYRNGKMIEEDYLDKEYISKYEQENSHCFNRTVGEITLGNDEYYVLGDNRPQSVDSRTFGPVSENQIVSRNVVYKKKRGYD